MSKQKITPRQRVTFFRAHHAACVNLGLYLAEEREAYRKQVMLEEAGAHHLADLGRTGDFDKVMKRFASDAGDYETACRFSVGDEARKIALVRICCEQVMQLKGCVAGTREAILYLEGVVEQAQVPCGRDLIDASFWMDVAPDSLLILFQILDTHRRRLLRARLGDKSVFLGFDPAVRYEIQDDGVRLVYDPAAYSTPSTSIRVNVRRS